MSSLSGGHRGPLGAVLEVRALGRLHGALLAVGPFRALLQRRGRLAEVALGAELGQRRVRAAPEAVAARALVREDVRVVARDDLAVDAAAAAGPPGLGEVGRGVFFRACEWVSVSSLVGRGVLPEKEPAGQ